VIISPKFIKKGKGGSPLGIRGRGKGKNRTTLIPIFYEDAQNELPEILAR
jgi:hypothetical protein